MIELTPVWIPNNTMEYIHKKHGSHIKRRDIRDIMFKKPKNLEIRTASKKYRADLLIKGKSFSGKKLLICVIIQQKKIMRVASELNLKENPEEYVALVYNAWEVSS